MATFTIQIWNSEFSAWRVPTRDADFSTLDDATKSGRKFREGSVYRVLDPEGNIAFLRGQGKIGKFPDMNIVKTTIEVVVLHHAADDVSSWDLCDIVGEMNEGCIVGGDRIIGTVSVPADQLAGELTAVGNDGSFFDYDTEDEGYPRLLLSFQPQDWDGDHAVEVGDAIEFDGTRAVLKLYGVEQLERLDQGEGNNDILVQRGATTPEIDELMSTGPYEVTATIGGVTEFFTINGFDGITYDALTQLRARYGVEA